MHNMGFMKKEKEYGKKLLKNTTEQPSELAGAILLCGVIISLAIILKSE
jgi:hypothetical protein